MTALQFSISKNNTLNFFMKNFILLFSGNASAQAVIILSSPILTRLYNPESFGLLELIISLFTVFSVFSNWKFDNAIVVQKGEKETDKVFLLCFFINIMMFLLTLGISWLLKYNDVYFFSHILGDWWWTPSFLAWLAGWQQAAQMYFIREKKYKIISFIVFLQAIGVVSLQIGLGSLENYNAFSLVLGYIINNIIVCLIFTCLFFKHKEKVFFSQFNSLYSKFLECRNFILYTVPTSLLGAVSQRSLFVMIGGFFTESDVGYAGLAMRVMYFPLTLITRSMSQLFFGIFSEKKGEPDFPQQINKILRLKIIIIPMIIPLIFNSPQLFVFCFGKNWLDAGYYAMLLSPATFTLFLTAWLDRTHDVVSQQKKALCLELCYDVLLIIGMISVTYLFNSPFYLVAFFGIFTALYNILWLILTVKLIGISYKTSLKNLILLLSCVIGFTFLYKFIHSFCDDFLLTSFFYYALVLLCLIIKKRLLK